MKEKHIGIIIQNQDRKILVHNDTCYIKVKVNKNDNINDIIKSKVKSIVDLDRFSIIKTYMYTPYSKLVDLNIISDEEMTMYLVEVFIYHNEYEFINIEELLEVISDHSEYEFFKENFVDYTKYKNISQSFIFNNILTLFNLLVYLGFSIEFSETLLLSLLFLTISGYFIVGNYIAPKFARYLMKSKVSISDANKLSYLSFILLLFILIKTYVL